MMLRAAAMAATLVLLGGCSSMSAWWSDEKGEAGQSAANAIVHEQPKSENIVIDWSVDVDQRKPASPAGFSIPLVAEDDGKPLIVAGGMDGRLRFLDTDGHELGWLALHGPCEAGAVQLDNGLVVLGDVEGWLYAIDPHDRRIVWNVQLSSLMQGHPVLTPQGVLVQTADNRIYHFAADGHKLWSYTGALGGLAMRAGSSPAVAGNRVYAVMNNGDAVALRLDTGDMLWKRQLVLDTQAAVLSEIRVPLADPLLLTVPRSFQDDYLLVVAIYQGRLLFLSPADGSEIRARGLSLKHRPLSRDQVLYVADSNGALYALDPASAQSIWKQQLSDGELVGPVYAGGFLWVADEKGRVYRLDEFGQVRGRIQLPGRIDRAPVPLAGGVLVRTSRGVLYRLH